MLRIPNLVFSFAISVASSNGLSSNSDVEMPGGSIPAGTGDTLNAQVVGNTAKSDKSTNCTTLYVQAGAMRGIQVLAILARLEELTGEPISNLFDNMEGGSVAGFLLAGANVRKSNDPASPDYHRPRYSMLDGLNMFVKSTPDLFPHIPSRLPLMGLTQLGDAALTVLGRIFGVVAQSDTVNVLHKDFMYNPAKLEALYKKVLGDNTRLSESLGTFHVPFYNMTEGHVEFFAAQSQTSSTSPPFVRHTNPKLWEVAMAATANSLAYAPYVVRNDGNPYVAFDGALFHRPTTHSQICGPNNGTLVQVVVNPVSDKPLSTTLQNSSLFRHLETIFGSNLITGGSPETLAETYGNSVFGVFNGGLSHVQHYMNDMETMNPVGSSASATITIAPPSLQPEEDPSIKPGLSGSFVATPDSIRKITEYALRELRSEDPGLKQLAERLLARRQNLGYLSPEEYQRRVAAIEKNDLADSPVLKTLQDIVNRQKNPDSIALTNSKPLTNYGVSVQKIGMTGGSDLIINAESISIADLTQRNESWLPDYRR